MTRRKGQNVPGISALIFTFLLFLKLKKFLKLNIKCDEAIHVKNINLYYVNFEIDANGNIKAFCSLVGFNSKGPFDNKFVKLLKV